MLQFIRVHVLAYQADLTFWLTIAQLILALATIWHLMKKAIAAAEEKARKKLETAAEEARRVLARQAEAAKVVVEKAAIQAKQDLLQ
jgi:cell division septum initiation protein DivIVA